MRILRSCFLTPAPKLKHLAEHLGASPIEISDLKALINRPT